MAPNTTDHQRQFDALAGRLDKLEKRMEQCLKSGFSAEQVSTLKEVARGHWVKEAIKDYVIGTLRFATILLAGVVAMSALSDGFRIGLRAFLGIV